MGGGGTIYIYMYIYISASITCHTSEAGAFCRQGEEGVKKIRSSAATDAGECLVVLV